MIKKLISIILCIFLCVIGIGFSDKISDEKPKKAKFELKYTNEKIEKVKEIPAGRIGIKFASIEDAETYINSVKNGMSLDISELETTDGKKVKDHLPKPKLSFNFDSKSYAYVNTKYAYKRWNDVPPCDLWISAMYESGYCPYIGRYGFTRAISSNTYITGATAFFQWHPQGNYCYKSWNGDRLSACGAGTMDLYFIVNVAFRWTTQGSISADWYTP